MDRCGSERPDLCCRATGNTSAACRLPKDSIRAYLLNLNTHKTYAALRQRRRDLRKEGKPLTGDALASGLMNYSERGQAYVDELRAIIHSNRLEEADFVTLRDMKPILLVPVGNGVN